MRYRFAAALFSTIAASTMAAGTSDIASVERVVDRFNAARAAFDEAALGNTLAPDYQEISPVGDVDDRAKVLGFYRADQRRAGPAIAHADRRTSLHGTFAIETERLSFTMTRPDGVSATRSMRARYVAVRSGRGWRLLSAQYTPMPPAK
ncbi:nuclear transport factor 2 family protein [Sphingomonadaceae bacterium OTU29THOMA1]|nr:nuclear transport factor 2 family protein [Sphingomonadaceae bacterium OTU29THOMA1]